MTSVPQFYVYVLVRPNGKPFYVGKGKGKRVFAHDKEAQSGHKCHKCNVIRKIWREGKDYQRYIVFTTDVEQEAFDYEKELIALYGRENLCNLTDGGEGAANPSEETRKKRGASIKEAWKTRVNRQSRLGYTNTLEHRRKIGKANKGRKHSPEQREKNRKAHLGLKPNLSPEQRQQLSDRMKGNRHGVDNPNIWNKGRSWSPEERKRISDTLKETSPWRGKKHADAAKQKLSEQRTGKPLCKEHCRELAKAWEQRRIRMAYGYTIYSPSGEQFHTYNLSAFARKHGMPYSGLRRAENTGRPYNGWTVTIVIE